ncbi:ribonuclease catalytic domain-containing protein [Brackiella oedipodis]|uniref:ribonuclease catalytic domain-containing protein n=1 Tax=Brackiella oedipodis TaxID=124225 RepID=UPI00048C84EE|nr:ribonuclease catalytic domain-containing protein [Brackiella oedipodis]
MHLIYEDSSQFKIARILSEAESSLQIENESGKRSKIKSNLVIFRFENKPSDMMSQAQAISDELDQEFLWQCAPSEEFHVDELAQDYFGEQVSATEKLAMLLKLHEHPVYFHRKGKGKYRTAPEDILQAALAALQKKQQQAEQQEAWAAQFQNLQVPEELANTVQTFLTHPDKNSLAWKAFDQACQALGMTVPQLLLQLGVYPHALALHWTQFLENHFPKGTAIAPTALDYASVNLEDLPIADVAAYSLDNSSTTEIDDALAVQALGDDIYQISVHIAAPALLIQRDSEADKLARQRMSTVYVPGTKIPMQADNVIAAFSLDENKLQPCVSLYIKCNIASGEILETWDKIERLQVKQNLRTDQLEADVSVAALEDEEQALPFAEFLRPLWQMRAHLCARREQVRGKPIHNDFIEYSFELEGPADDPASVVLLRERPRNAPLDLLVQEYMLYANQHWAGLLKQLNLSGIFRSQQGGRVRQSTYPGVHEAIGVEQYGWMTSPLRRYVDLLNQQQLICAIEHGVSARLVAPYPAKSVDLMAIIAQFETTYTHWRNFQEKMERYWCLRWIEQQQIHHAQAVVTRDNWVRFCHMPLSCPLNDLPDLARDTVVDVEIMGCDLLTLTLDCRYQKVLQSPQVTHQEQESA